MVVDVVSVWFWVGVPRRVRAPVEGSLTLAILVAVAGEGTDSAVPS